MIEKVQSYKVGEKFFTTFDEAQKAELVALLDSFAVTDSENVASGILSTKAHFIDVLTSTPRSRAKARKINGATRKRKTKPTLITDSETGA